VVKLVLACDLLAHHRMVRRRCAARAAEARRRRMEDLACHVLCRVYKTSAGLSLL
jgi:hypothetical protein